MTSTKCGHESCQCMVDADDFCSDYCEDRGETSGIEGLDQGCRCGHAACSD